MFISDFAIKKPVVTTTVMLALVVFGIIALFMLDTDEFPEVNPPVVAVSIPYPGASPDGVEREVVEPIEEAISSISGVDDVNSQALDGFASIVVIFDFEKDLQQATQDIRDAISGIRGDLPLEMEEPILTRFDPQDLPIVSLALSSAQLGAPELSRIADPGLTRELRAITGVAQVNVVGDLERELTVELRPDALQAAGVGVGQVVQALQQQNLAAPVGRLGGDLNERTIRLRGRLESPQDFEQLVVSQVGGRLIRLGEVATVRDATEEPRSLALFNGERAVGIDIVKTTNASTTAVSERVLERVEQLQETLPAGVTLRTVQDAGDRVERSVEQVQSALFEGAILTVLVVFLFLNSWRSTVITGLALPVSVLASFIAVWAFGFTLNTMSLLGLSLAIGILIDDAIVVRENIVRHVEMGKDHYTASREGTSEIGLAVAATTFAIVSVFVPIAFMGGIAEQWFAPFALTIACSVLVSLFVSFSLDPMLSAYWPDPHVPEEKKAWITRQLDKFNRWFDRQAENYKYVIGWALDHRSAMVLIALGSFILALAIPQRGVTGFLAGMAVLTVIVLVLVRLQPNRWLKLGLVLGGIPLMILASRAVPVAGKLGSEFFPKQDLSEFSLKIETPPGSNLDYTRIKAEEAARIARAHEEVKYTYTTIGGRGGAVDEATVYIALAPKKERDVGQQMLEERVRREVGSIGGAQISLVTGGFGGDKQIQLQFQGPDLATLNRIAEQVMAEVKQVPGAVDVGLSTKGQKPELDVQINRGLAGTLGISVGQVAQALRPAFAGIDAGDWVDPQGLTRDVVVRLAPESRRRAADLAALPLVLPSPQGPVTLPLQQVATINEGIGPAQISRLDRDRVIAVQANTEGRPLNEVTAEIQQRIAPILQQLPPGYSLREGGETESQREVFGRILVALVAAVLLMYLILVMQFGSFLDPFAIMLSLPLSLIGVVLALLITGSTLNLMSMIGVILLMGIVAKNAILLIDFAKWSHEGGMPLREALIEAGRTRLRPIIMTTAALVAGMVPIAIGAGEGGDFRAPLGRAVIGGVITSTLLTLLVIPTVYEILADTREWLFERIRGRRKAAEPPHGARPRPAHGRLEPEPVAGD